jgi:hypothetical protein
MGVTGSRHRARTAHFMGVSARLAAAMLCALLVCVSVAVATPPPPATYGDLSQAQRIAFIEDLVAKGDLDQAQRFLSGSRFTEDDLGYAAAFLQAMIFHRQGRLSEAEKLLRLIVLERPAYSRVRLELAGLLAASGNREGAAYHLRLLADSAEDPGSRRRFESFIEQVNPDRPFSLSGFVSIAPSSNINNGSANDTIYIAGLPFAIAPGARATSGLGVRGGLVAAYTRRLDENLVAYAAGSSVASEYSGKNFDTLTGDIRLGLRRQALDYLIGAELIADRRYIALTATDYGVGARLFTRKPLAPKLLLSGETQFIVRNYDLDPTLRARTFSAEARLDYSYAVGRSVHAKVGVVNEEVRLHPHNSYVGGHVEIGTVQPLPMGILTSLALKTGVNHYRADFPGMREPRRDRFLELRSTFLKANLNWQGFTPRLGLSYYVQKSNVALYEYDKISADVTFTREF